MQKLVIDTNIFISYLISNKGFSFKIIEDLFVNKKASLFISNIILEEYYKVFNRTKFINKRFDFIEAANALYENIEEFAVKIEPVKIFDLIKDKPDNRFLEVAYTANADYLITGNSLHFTFSQFYNTQIVSPREYWGNYKP